MKRLLIAQVAIAAVAFPVAYPSLSKVVAPKEPVTIRYCYDGDTCTSNHDEKFRLACIDTPEIAGRKAQPKKALAARNYLRRFLQGKEITVKRHFPDKFNRTVAELYADGKNVQEEMVQSGHADVFWKYADPCPWTEKYRM